MKKIVPVNGEAAGVEKAGLWRSIERLVDAAGVAGEIFGCPVHDGRPAGRCRGFSVEIGKALKHRFIQFHPGLSCVNLHSNPCRPVAVLEREHRLRRLVRIPLGNRPRIGFVGNGAGMLRRVPHFRFAERGGGQRKCERSEEGESGVEVHVDWIKRPKGDQMPCWSGYRAVFSGG